MVASLKGLVIKQIVTTGKTILRNNVNGEARVCAADDYRLPRIAMRFKSYTQLVDCVPDYRR